MGRSHALFRFSDYLRGRPRYVTLTLAFVLLVGLGLVDYWSGAELAISIFYLAPIGLTAWVLGGRWAMGVAALATLIWFWADAATGSVYQVEFIPYWNALMRFGYFVLISYLFAFVAQTLERERRLSRTDTLTGALNKLAFGEVAEAELERLRRYPHPLTVAYLDLDNFKAVNDQHGHAVGDELLISVASQLRSSMRKTDIVTRLGGDEFAILMLETGPEAARKAFIKVQANLLNAMNKRGWPVTFSIGVVTFLQPPAGTEEMLALADRTMYRAKHRGKNRVVYDVVRSDEPERWQRATA